MDHEPQTQPENLPELLKEDLQKLYGQAASLDEGFDRRVLDPCIRILSDTPTSTQHPGRFVPWAAAAVLAAMVGAGWMLTQSHGPQTPPHHVSVRSEDLDGNGRIDILDAFALARQLKSGTTVQHPDLNGDGRVDQTDVQALAAQAVRLKGNG